MTVAEQGQHGHDQHGHNEGQHGHHGHHEEKKQFDITVIYNGVPKEIRVRREETVKQVLDRAVAAFAPLPQPHLMSLFNQAGVELNDTATVEQAGIHEHDKLLLRPSQVKGG